MLNKLFEINDNYIYVDENSNDIVTPNNTINSANYLESHNYKCILYLKNKLFDFNEGTVVIAEDVNGSLLYYDEFEDIIKPEFRNK